MQCCVNRLALYSCCHECLRGSFCVANFRNPAEAAGRARWYTAGGGGQGCQWPAASLAAAAGRTWLGSLPKLLEEEANPSWSASAGHAGCRPETSLCPTVLSGGNNKAQCFDKFFDRRLALRKLASRSFTCGRTSRQTYKQNELVNGKAKFLAPFARYSGRWYSR